jgi:hypothetical protein
MGKRKKPPVRATFFENCLFGEIFVMGNALSTLVSAK